LPALPSVLHLAARPGRSLRWLRLTAGLLGAAALATFLTLKLTLPPGVPALVGAGGVAFAAAAFFVARGRLAETAAALLVASGLLLGLAVPRLFPPPPALPPGPPLVSRHVLVETPGASAIAVWREEELKAAWARGDRVVVRQADVTGLGFTGSTVLARWPRLARNVPVADVWLALRLGWPPPSEDWLVLKRP
jgi:hypothetical protein